MQWRVDKMWIVLVGVLKVRSAKSARSKRISSAVEKPRVRRIDSLVSQLMSRRGYAQVAANEALQQVMTSEVGEALAGTFQVGNLKRGVLQVYVNDSVTMQELNFRKRAILKRIHSDMPENKITDLRFRVQT